MRSRRIATIVAVLLTAVSIAFVVSAPSATAADGPRISIDHDEVNPGDAILVSISGFKGFAVTVAMCGNLAKRGSSDCAMSSSQGEQIDQYKDVTLTRLIVQPPPATCPCLIRAVSINGDEFAVAPITLIGHPVGPIVGVSNDPLVKVDVHAKRVSEGLVGSLRTALGGKTKYSVTVSVQNITTETLPNISLIGSAGNAFSDDAAKLPLGSPGPIDPGQTWTKTMEVEVPAPVLGHYTWTVTAYGAGQSVTDVEGMSTMPILFYLLVIVFIVDIGFIAWRILARRRARRADTPVEGLVDLTELLGPPPQEEPLVPVSG